MRALTLTDPALLGAPHQSYSDWLRATYSLSVQVPLTTSDPTADLSGNGRDLDWTGTGPSAGTLFDAGGVTLAGATDSRFNGGSYASWMGAIRTIGVWVKTTSTSDIALWSGRPLYNMFALYHDNTNGLRLLLGYSAGNFTHNFGSGAFKINDGNLHSVVAAWTTTAATLWVDGVQRITGDMSANNYSPATNVSWGFGGGDGGGRKFVGQIGHGFASASTLTLSDAQAIDTAGRSV